MGLGVGESFFIHYRTIVIVRSKVYRVSRYFLCSQAYRVLRLGRNIGKKNPAYDDDL